MNILKANAVIIFGLNRQEAFLSDLISAFPQIFIDKYLVNTSFDSGSLTLDR